jgi:hypothetical protein
VISMLCPGVRTIQIRRHEWKGKQIESRWY